MADIYVDPAASGSNNGTDWTNAYTTLQSAMDNLSAGDSVYCRGTETLSASIDIDTTSGAASTPVYIIGVNSSGVEDGTLYTLDGNSTATNCLKINSALAITHYCLRNIKCINATSDGIEFGTSTNQWWIIHNLVCSNNGGMGIDCGAAKFRNSFVSQATLSGNSSFGMFYLYEGVVEKSFIINNSASGLANMVNVYDCIVHNNNGWGISSLQRPNSVIVNCVFDGNTTGGVNITQEASNISNSRITNHSSGTGLSISRTCYYDNIFFYNNNTDVSASGQFTYSGPHNIYSSTGDGYVDRTNDDFSLASNAEGRSVAVIIGDLAQSSPNYSYISQGLQADASGGGGGSSPDFNGGMI